MTHHGLHGFTQMKKYIFDFPALYLCKSRVICGKTK